MAEERGRVGARRAQACGFVSSMIVKREGGGSEGEVSVSRVDGGQGGGEEGSLPSEVLL